MTRVGWGRFALVGFLWGLPYLFIKVAVEEISPSAVIFFRVLIGVMVLLPLALMQKKIRISPTDLDWPIPLMDLSSPPIGLVIKGNRELLGCLDKSISIVGSRRPTEYGLAVSNKLAADSAATKVVVISGGAYGIDTAAHNGAVGAGGGSVAVLAGGFNHLYPTENKKLFSQITNKGLLISEVMPTVKSQPSRFLIRNRLIAALSKATVVVEAEFVSGSIRTARDAAEIFRPVFAIPGQISSPLSAGCHRLIADRVADIATTLVEILEVITPLQKR